MCVFTLIATSPADTVLKVSTHLNDIGDDFSIGRKCLSVNRISAEFLRANDIGAVWAVLKFSAEFESNSQSEDRKENHFGIKPSSTNKLSGK